MKVEKASLVAMLLEVGEENAAVLLARSTLPDELDTEHDLDVAGRPSGWNAIRSTRWRGMTIGEIEPDDVNTRRRRDELDKTISRRWADLVDQWLS